MSAENEAVIWVIRDKRTGEYMTLNKRYNRVKVTRKPLAGARFYRMRSHAVNSLRQTFPKESKREHYEIVPVHCTVKEENGTDY